MKAERSFEQKLLDAARAQRTGGAGRFYGASPTQTAVDEQIAEAIASVTDTSDVGFKNTDIFPLTTGGAQDLTLSFLPLDESEHVYLRGVAQLPGTDWTRDGQTLHVLSPMDARSGDDLWVEYAYLTGVPATVADGSFSETFRNASYDHAVTTLGTAYLTATGGVEGPSATRVISDSAGDGWLRFTNDSAWESGAIVFNQTFDSTKSYVFEWSYSMPKTNGADGISFFLLDGTASIPSVPGGANGGGALGYASHHNATYGHDAVGIAHGYLGVGFDVTGSWENAVQVGTGGASVVGDDVGFRGAGNSGTQNDGSYPWLTGTNLFSSIGGFPRTAPCHARVTVTPSGGSLLVTVERDTGSGYTTIISNYDVEAVNGAPPSLYRFGFGGSSGQASDVHEIRDFTATES